MLAGSAKICRSPNVRPSSIRCRLKRTRESISYIRDKSTRFPHPLTEEGRSGRTRLLIFSTCVSWFPELQLVVYLVQALEFTDRSETYLILPVSLGIKLHAV